MQKPTKHPNAATEFCSVCQYLTCDLCNADRAEVPCIRDSIALLQSIAAPLVTGSDQSATGALPGLTLNSFNLHFSPVGEMIA
ncbi:MAG: hypothetical protein JMN24_01715 [gamma proteobacterium endosymbiont of Lamellibrachia anaximandri]|nr:hypothetical protein [gamma proteobacterium endosymbiont of Lamellibrachia anaximandri]MBL3618750.1 hypothetical protein [gamma proteobacterium endosymbiont of Lamellibrachia anaximandri]